MRLYWNVQKNRKFKDKRVEKTFEHYYERKEETVEKKNRNVLFFLNTRNWQASIENRVRYGVCVCARKCLREKERRNAKKTGKTFSISFYYYVLVVVVDGKVIQVKHFSFQRVSNFISLYRHICYVCTVCLQCAC